MEVQEYSITHLLKQSKQRSQFISEYQDIKISSFTYHHVELDCSDSARPDKILDLLDKLNKQLESIQFGTHGILLEMSIIPLRITHNGSCAMVVKIQHALINIHQHNVILLTIWSISMSLWDNVLSPLRIQLESIGITEI
jgi:hypothetical protein